MNNQHPEFKVPPGTSEGEGIEFFSIPVNNVPRMASEYVSALETGETLTWCKCEWIIHPDDQNIDTTICKDCGHSLDLYFGEEEHLNGHKFCHAFECGHDGCAPKRRRMRRGAVDMTCPVHTKEGLILGFFEWVFKD